MFSAHTIFGCVKEEKEKGKIIYSKLIILQTLYRK